MYPLQCKNVYKVINDFKKTFQIRGTIFQDMSLNDLLSVWSFHIKFRIYSCAGILRDNIDYSYVLYVRKVCKVKLCYKGKTFDCYFYLSERSVRKSSVLSLNTSNLGIFHHIFTEFKSVSICVAKEQLMMIAELGMVVFLRKM